MKKIMKNKRGQVLTMTLLGLGLLTGTAHATLLSGTGGPLSNATLSAGVQEGFDAVATQNIASITLGNVTYSGMGANLDIGSDYNGSYNTSGGKSIFNGSDLVPAGFRFDFATVVDAFAFNWGAADNTWTLKAYDASNNLIESHAIAGTFGSNAGNYYGIAAAGIKWATVTDTFNKISGGDFVFIDNFTTVSGTVPEPVSFGLLGLGLLGLGFSRRKTR